MGLEGLYVDIENRKSSSSKDIRGESVEGLLSSIEHRLISVDAIVSELYSTYSPTMKGTEPSPTADGGPTDYPPYASDLVRNLVDVDRSVENIRMRLNSMILRSDLV